MSPMRRRAGRLAPGRSNALLTYVLQSGQIVHARAANNAEHSFGHNRLICSIPKKTERGPQTGP